MTPFFRFLLMVVTFASASGFAIIDDMDVDQCQTSHQFVSNNVQELISQPLESPVSELHRNEGQISEGLPFNARSSPSMNIRWNDHACSNQSCWSAGDEVTTDFTHHQTCTARRTRASNSFESVNSATSCKGLSPDVRQQPVQCPTTCLASAEVIMPPEYDASRIQVFCSFTSITQFWPGFTLFRNPIFCDSSLQCQYIADMGQQNPDPITRHVKMISHKVHRSHEVSPDSTFCPQAPVITEVCQIPTCGPYPISTGSHTPWHIIQCIRSAHFHAQSCIDKPFQYKFCGSPKAVDLTDWSFDRACLHLKNQETTQIANLCSKRECLDVTSRDSDTISFMQRPQRPSAEFNELSLPGHSSHSVIPEDWLLDLQRLAQQLERQCATDYPEGVLFTVYTWYLDHAISQQCNDPKLATLGGFPNEWEEDILFPWRHKIRPEHVFLDVVSPSVSRISIEEHIAHVIITQRQQELISVLLVLDFSRAYSRRMIIRRAIAVPKVCTLQDIALVDPVVADHVDSLQWEYPALSHHHQSFRTRNGMSLQLRIVETEREPDEFPLDAFSTFQTFIQQSSRPSTLVQTTATRATNAVASWCPVEQHAQALDVDSGPHQHQAGLSRTSIRHGIDLPPEEHEERTYDFNIHAPPFIPTDMPQEHFPDYVHELFDVWGNDAFSWEGELASTTIITWFVDHMVLYPIGIESRIVQLYADVNTWEPAIRRCWQDVLDPQQPVEFRIVNPAPPQLEPGITAHVIVVQAVRPTWASSLVSVDDPWMTVQNSGHIMRLVVTTDLQFMVDHIVQVCGYPVGCLYSQVPIQCQATIQNQPFPPGINWLGSTGNSIMLQVTRPAIVPIHAEQDPNVALCQTGVVLHAHILDEKTEDSSHAVSTLAVGLAHQGDAISFMAHGTRARQHPEPTPPLQTRGSRRGVSRWFR